MIDLDVAKLSLAEIGTRSTISSLDPLVDTSEEALYASMYYALVRDHALRAAHWNFAKHNANLTVWKALPGTPENPTTTTTGWTPAFPAPPWIYSYSLPADFLYARSIICQPDISTMALPLYPIAGATIAQPRALRAPFEMSTDGLDTDGMTPLTPQKRVLLTNQQKPVFEYTYLATDPNLWDESFTMTLVLALAARLAIALTSDKSLAQLKVQEANALIMEARRQDGNEGLTILDSIPDWLRVRGVGGGYNPYNFYYPYGSLFVGAP
jgi:hypothetical protein